MKVGRYRDWLRHLNRGDRKPMEVWVARDKDIYLVASQTVPGARYKVAYRADQRGEFIACDCPAGRRGLACKHSAYVLANIHAREFRQLVREEGK